MPFPTMRTALNNGQVDAIWAPEPFVTQALSLDGDRIVMAPGPVLGALLADRRLRRAERLGGEEPAASQAKFRTAINQSLAYAQAIPTRSGRCCRRPRENVRLPIWSPLVDRDKLVQLAKYTKEFGVISTLPNFAAARAERRAQSGKTLQATVGANFVTLRLRRQGA